MEIKALTITQYLIQGTPEGLIAAYVSNWTGQCLKFSRNLLLAAKDREEFKRPGIYFLIGQQPSEVDTWSVYVGESEGLDVRIGEHDRDFKKDFWEHAVIFSSKDENLTKGHVRYLEYRLQEDLRLSKRIKLININTTKPKLPEASVAEMETYLDFLKLVMPALGFPFFNKSSPGELGVRNQTLYLQMSGLKAEGYLTPQGIVVKSGSDFALKSAPALSGNYNLLRQTLIKQSFVDSVKGKFVADYEFSSPSAAGAVVLGYNVNGRDAWKSHEGQSINQLEPI